jgi:hypothetical protein
MLIFLFLGLRSNDRTAFHGANSEKLEPERVDALAVNTAAGALLRLKGRPVEQARLVQNLQPSIAAALCRWLADPAFWGMVGGITRH